MSIALIVVVFLICFSVFVNGWTDAPNALAAVISTRVLKPRAAIVLGIVFNTLGVFVLGSSVAVTMANIVTIGTGRDALVTLGAVQFAVIIWIITAWRFGIPASGTHAMVAALLGAGISVDGMNALNMEYVFKVLIGMLSATLAGFTLSFIATKMIRFSSKNIKRGPADRFFSAGQICSASLMIFSNGAQDGQKFMGIFYLALVLGGRYPEDISSGFTIPIWIMLLCAILMAAGISSAGYRIIKRMGMEMVQLEKYQGFAAELVSSGSMIVSTLVGIPMSSTNVKSAAMIGAGAVKGINKVKWGVARDIMIAWALTFPICILLGFLLAELFRFIF
ncbi:inorganic phosphate transporter [Parasporobacterium paucivorans]|uniref:Inorganic phosphate transporter, PiT family n=1 Tax=Parasporobacterium paucivorans DSM 15970 TaxID=1122934 RepID=A0A1M6L9G2_9FIRM|nr:inorganic phosphate transporter [Parasporobacterium paucivorans]SHJ67804.1 inorganic phosphate transporter, PiT family [Parasporobacterium paucivorans DSM 15970]